MNSYPEKKIGYTPGLTFKNSCSLRRIAWALNAPMTKTLNVIMEKTIEAIKPELVCRHCKDKTRCAVCGFNRK